MRKSLPLPMSMALQWSSPAPATSVTKTKQALIEPMRWIGIDPGLRTTGFGIIDVDGQKMTYVASGTIESGDPKKGLPERLGTLYSGVKEVLDTYHPESAAIEEVFLNVNPRSTLMLGQARGSVIAALVSAKLSVAEYSALRVKQSIVGTGRATSHKYRRW